MKINRRVKDVECEIMVPFGMNKDISEMHNNLVDCIEDRIHDLVPFELKEKLEDEEFAKAKKNAIHYALDLLKESEMEYTTCMEDTMCFLYDELENIESEDACSNKYYMIRGTRVDHAMTRDFLSANHIMHDVSNDPLNLTIEEAIENALDRGLPRNDGDGIKNDVYAQLYGSINESDIIDDVVDEYMIRNSI